MEWNWDMDNFDLNLSNLNNSRYFSFPELSSDTPSSSSSNSQESTGSNPGASWSMEVSPNSSCSNSSGINSVDLVSLDLENLGVAPSTASLSPSSTTKVPQDFFDNGYVSSSFDSARYSIWGPLDNNVTEEDWKSFFKPIFPAPCSSSSSSASRVVPERPSFKPFVPKKPQVIPVPAISIIPNVAQPLMGVEAIFFVQSDEAGKPLPRIDSLLVTIQHPDNFIHPAILRLDTSNPGLNRYFFSFVPRLLGQHVISVKLRISNPLSHGPNDQVKEVYVAGGPKVVFVSRDYEGVKRDSFNHLRIGFSKPVVGKGWGIAVDSRTKNAYLTDRDDHQILVVNSKGAIVNRFGKMGGGPGQLWRPTGIAVDEVNNRLVISDKDNHRIGVYNLRGEYCFSFGSEGHQNGQFNYPWGVDVSKDGQFIAVADSRNHRVQMFDLNGNFVSKFSVFEVRPFDYKTEFDYPRGVAFDNSGENLYVTDFNVNAVFKLTSDLKTKEQLCVGELFNRPQGVAVDPAGNILVCDSKANLIRVIKPDGGHVCSLDRTAQDLFHVPTDLAVYRDGQVAVLDLDSRFRVF